MSGRWIVYEGLDGSGKSTAIAGVKAALEAEGRKVYLTREPSDGEIGKLIRQALTKKVRLHEKTFTMLFAADRYEHVLNEIIPALEEGCDVLCDRYYFSNLAYQGDVATADEILNFNAPARALAGPDLVLYVDTPPEVCMARISGNRSETELFEKLDKLKSVQQLYLEAFERLRTEETIVCVDGTLPQDEVVKKCLEAMDRIPGPGKNCKNV